MSRRSNRGWVNHTTGRPKIQGSLEISINTSGVFIGGDPDGLRSFADVLIWLADVDQEAMSRQPRGERCHVHFHANDAPGFNSLTHFSCETELCRLDAKGTGDFADRYCQAREAFEKPVAKARTPVKPKSVRSRGRKLGPTK